MFLNKQPNPNPLGVPLGDLLHMLLPTSIKATRPPSAGYDHQPTPVPVTATPACGRMLPVA